MKKIVMQSLLCACSGLNKFRSNSNEERGDEQTLESFHLFRRKIIRSFEYQEKLENFFS